MQSDDSRTAREIEAHEMKIRKELEKQDNLRRKVFIEMSLTCYYEVYR